VLGLGDRSPITIKKGSTFTDTLGQAYRVGSNCELTRVGRRRRTRSPSHTESAARQVPSLPGQDGSGAYPFSPKAISVQPMKFLSDDEWFKAITDVAARARERFKSVFLHTHFNHPREVTPLVEAAMRRVFSEGIYVRNQSVLLRGVNDNSCTLVQLVKDLGRVNIQSYYVYACDMVVGCEHFRVPVQEMQHLEREVRGVTAGFNTPLFVVDAPGGGGKRDVHSYEYRDDKYGIIGFRAPAVNPNRMYFYFDPLRSLGEVAQTEWRMGGRDAILARLPHFGDRGRSLGQRGAMSAHESN